MEIRDIFVKNLKNLMLLNGKTQTDLVEDLGLKQSSVSDWVRKVSYPRANNMQKLADYFDVNISELIAENNKGGIGSPSIIRLNVYKSLSAGVTNYTMNEIVGIMEVPRRQAKDGELIALKIKGDFLSPKIEHDDVVIIRLQTHIDNGDFIVFNVGGDDAIVRKASINEYGVTFMPLNQRHEAIFFTKQEMKSIPIRIIGKVVEVRRTF